MKQIKSYNDFKLNEGFFSNLWSKMFNLYDKLLKKYKSSTWQYYHQQMKKDGMLPKGVKIYGPLIGYGLRENVSYDETINLVNEDKVPLAHQGSVMNVNGAYLQQRIKDFFHRRTNPKGDQVEGKLTSTFIWGAPGIGKTQIIQQVAKYLDIELIIFHLSLIEPTDFRGLPFVVDKEMTDEDGKKIMTKRSDNAVPLIFPTNNGDNGKGGILFLDELNLANPYVLKAAMPLAQDGEFNGYKLPSKWIIIAAGNRLEDVKDMRPTPIKGALANRFRHMNFVPTVKEWSVWAKNKSYIDKNLIAFFSWNKEYFHYLDTKTVEVWASPRTWTEASEEIYDKYGNWNIPRREMHRNYYEVVGPVASQEFMNYLSLIEKVSEKQIEDIYTKGKFLKLPDTLSEANPLLSAIVYSRAGKKLKSSEYKNILNFILSLKQMEFITPFLRLLKKAHSDLNDVCYLKTEEPYKTDYMGFVKKWAHIIDEMEKGNQADFGDYKVEQELGGDTVDTEEELDDEVVIGNDMMED